LLSGCLYSVQHFNTGRILDAGRSQTTLGMGRQTVWRCAGGSDSAAAHVCGDSAGESAERGQLFKGSVDFRLGIAKAWGPFPGAELQWRMEAPTSPATMEFGLNLALPGSAAFRHKIGAGWGIGAWADNSLFAEYAASRSLGRPSLFGNLRVTWMATPIEEVLGSDFISPLPSRRRLVAQAGAGVAYRLPEWPVVPDLIIPQFNATFPQVPGGGRFRAADVPPVQWDMSLGIGWAL
jgi:hypothetical protein